jgi:hypothetical protein
MAIFHRYQSTIHGDYRRNYLRCGLVTGVLLAAYVLVRLLMNRPVESPLSYVSDAILLVCIFLFAAYYRNALPDKRVTLKELMLFGMGTAAVAALLYGLMLWGIGLAFPQQAVLFTNNMTPNEVTMQDPQLHYWAALWAIVAAVETLLLGSFGAFLAAILFRNEKGEIKHKKQ